MAAPVPVLQKGAEDYGAEPLRHDLACAEVEGALRAAATALGLNWGDLLTLVSGLWFAREDPAATGAPVIVWLPFMSRMGSASARIPAMVVNILPLEVGRARGEALPETLAWGAACASAACMTPATELCRPEDVEMLRLGGSVTPLD